MDRMCIEAMTNQIKSRWNRSLSSRTRRSVRAKDVLLQTRAKDVVNPERAIKVNILVVVSASVPKPWFTRSLMMPLFATRVA